MVTVKTLNSLAKVYPDRELNLSDLQDKGCMLKNEAYSFQVAYKMNTIFHGTVCASFETSEEIKDKVSLRYIDYVPCDLTMFDFALSTSDHPEPGLFPDVLKPIPKVLWGYKLSWRGLFVTIDGSKEDLKPGNYKIAVSIKADKLYTVEYEIEVLDKKLPAQDLPVTNWFHTDCLCNYYKVEFDSEEYWRITENFAKTAVEYGINMLLAPIFTPPLDTQIGGERRTIQLVDVYKNGDKYTFGFGKLVKWIEMCKRVGVEMIEISHLFTQWGCKYAPKVMAYENGEYKRIFGWDTIGHSEEYLGFLEQLMPALIDELKRLDVFEKSYFHVSDEPDKKVMEEYKKCAEFLRRFVPSERIFDALSEIEFYEEGLISCPVVSLDHIHPFIDKNVKPLWGYYCGCQVTTANRFVACPSGRNRVLGVQLYKYNIAGFLQWGYNFYNSHLSLYEVDPYASSTAGGWLIGGDSFVVYPGDDGRTVASLRLEIFREALQDLRALRALEKKLSDEGIENAHDEVIRLLELDELKFDKFNSDSNYLISLREKINRML